MKRSLTLTILISGMLLMCLWFYHENEMIKLEQARNIISEHHTFMQSKIDFYEFNNMIEYKMINEKAPDVMCSEYKKDSIRISEVVKEHSILIFRYSDINCNTCYESAINEMKETLGDAFQYVAILCTYSTERDLIVFKKINQIRFPIYLVSSGTFSWVIEEYNNPYFFVLHSDLKISNIYVPNKSFPDRNLQYLEGVKRLLSSN